MKRMIAAGLLGLSMSVSGLAFAEPVKVGLITTLSGGGAGLGIDARDGFMLALKNAGDAASEIEVITEDDGQKPELAVQIADKMIQSDQVDVLTGIIWSNLAMAVVPSAVAQGKFYLSVNAGPSALAGAQCNENYFNVAYQNDNFHEAMGQYATEDLQEDLHHGAELSGRHRLAHRLQALLQRRTRRRGLYAARTDRLCGRDRADPRFGCRFRVHLPAGRHGHRLHEAVRAVGRRYSGDRTRLLLQPGRAAALSAMPRSA
jgi:hypothetical protein